MSTIHVKYGLEFRPDLYQSHDRSAWLEAVGSELEKKGLSLKLGEGNQLKELNSGAELKEFYQRYESDPTGVAAELGLEPGRDIQRYISDLVQALDDIVKDSSKVQTGTTVDLTPTSEMSKMLGLDNVTHRYASSRTPFGDTASVQGTTSVLGIMLSREAVPADPLEGVPHISAATFEGQTLKTGRRSTEVEAVRTLDGLSKDQLIELLRTERGGRPVLRRIRKAKDAEAYSVGYSGVGVNEMRWDSRAHSIREANPYMSVTIESGRLEKDEDDGEYEVGLGTDYNEDTYYDTADFSLLDNDLSLRARIRRDDAVVGPDGVRRVLIQSKIGSAVDEQGNKSAAKADIRKDSPSAEDIAGLDEDLRTGVSGWGWNGREEPIEAVGLIHKALQEKDALPDIGDHEDVLLLEAKAHVRSTRSRFHYNETGRDASISFMNQIGEPNIREALELVKGSTTLDAQDGEAITRLGEGILDRSAIVDRVKDQLIALDPSLEQSGVTADTINALMPDKRPTTDKLEVKKRKVVADALKGAYDELSELIDDNRQNIAGSRTDIAREYDHAEDFVDFMKSRDPDSRSIMTFKPFIEKLDAQLAGPEKDAFLEEFKTWAADNGIDAYQNAADLDAAMGGLRQNLVNEHLDIMHRQLEAAGSTGQTLWFDNARKAYANNDRNWGNFLIDTFDVSEFYTPEVWNGLTDEQKAGAEDISGDKMYHAMVVNEVQIELGYEKPFTEAIAKAEEALDGARAGVFMDYALDKGLQGVAADQPDSFRAALDTAMSLPEAERNAFFDELSAFAKDKGSALSFSPADFGDISDSLFTTNRQGQDFSGHGQLVEDKDMSEFVWQTMLDMQEHIADLRGRRVKREAERAGFDDVEWNNSAMSKGDTALTILQE